jgi:hypothetical protein
MSQTEFTLESKPQEAQDQPRFLTEGIEWSPAAIKYLHANQYEFTHPNTLNLVTTAPDDATNSQSSSHTQMQEIMKWHEDKVDQWAATDPRFESATSAIIWYDVT